MIDGADGLESVSGRWLSFVASDAGPVGGEGASAPARDAAAGRVGVSFRFAPQKSLAPSLWSRGPEKDSARSALGPRGGCIGACTGFSMAVDFGAVGTVADGGCDGALWAAGPCGGIIFVPDPVKNCEIPDPNDGTCGAAGGVEAP